MKAPRIWARGFTALGFGLCLLLAWIGSRGEETPRVAHTAAASSEAGEQEAPPPPAPPERPREQSSPVDTKRAFEPEPPRPEVSSWVVPLELGWEGANAEAPIRTQVAFQLPRPHASDTVFEACFSDQAGREMRLPVPVRDLLTPEEAQGRGLVFVGDQALVARGPVLLRLPDLPLPLRVALYRPDGKLAATLVLEDTQDGPRTRVE